MLWRRPRYPYPAGPKKTAFTLEVISPSKIATTELALRIAVARKIEVDQLDLSDAPLPNSATGSGLKQSSDLLVVERFSMKM
jgi:hypothetical protein